MIKSLIPFALFLIGICSCNSSRKETKATQSATYPDVQIAGAMRDVMWKGELAGKISLDSIADREGLYGLGPESFLTGEVMINNGVGYVSKVTSDTTMIVEKRLDITAPFFVYTRVKEWFDYELPKRVKTIKALEEYIDSLTTDRKRPFAFKLTGQVSQAKIHIQDLPEGTKVSSPAEAHQGQVTYPLNNRAVEIIGFFSTEHQGVFTHHDSYLHMHLITSDERMMGHVDFLDISQMKLYLPKS